MRKELLNFFSLLRSIFGVCPHSGEFFRLSDCKIYLKSKPTSDWMDKLEATERRLELLEEKFSSKEKSLRMQAREKGRKTANQTINKLDKVFKPLKLNPDDSKVIFHPVDYIVFNGMKIPYTPRQSINGPIKSICFLDRQVKDKTNRAIQRSIEKAIEKEKYDWQALRVIEDGRIKVE